MVAAMAAAIILIAVSNPTAAKFGDGPPSHELHEPPRRCALPEGLSSLGFSLAAAGGPPPSAGGSPPPGASP